VIGIKEKKRARRKADKQGKARQTQKAEGKKEKKKTTISRPNVCPRRIYKNEMVREKTEFEETAKSKKLKKATIKGPNLGNPPQVYILIKK